jgi:hypothetical protein
MPQFNRFHEYVNRILQKVRLLLRMSAERCPQQQYRHLVRIESLHGANFLAGTSALGPFQCWDFQSMELQHLLFGSIWHLCRL